MKSAPECTITIADDESLAPFHFQIKVEPPVVWLVDCGSSFGAEVKHFLMSWVIAASNIYKEFICLLALASVTELSSKKSRFVTVGSDIVHAAEWLGKAIEMDWFRV